MRKLESEWPKPKKTRDDLLVVPLDPQQFPATWAEGSYRIATSSVDNPEPKAAD